MKNAFYFTLKALFVLKYSNFCLDFLVLQKNDLIREIRLILKFMSSKSGKQIIIIHILLNISRSKDNQTMRFGQLIQYNIRNIFPKKKIHEKWRNLWSNSLIFCTVFLICKVEGYRSTLKISCRPIVFTTNEDFLKYKKKSRPSFNATFPALFLKKNISFVMFY